MIETAAEAKAWAVRTSVCAVSQILGICERAVESHVNGAAGSGEILRSSSKRPPPFPEYLTRLCEGIILGQVEGGAMIHAETHSSGGLSGEADEFMMALDHLSARDQRILGRLAVVEGAQGEAAALAVAERMEMILRDRTAALP